MSVDDLVDGLFVRLEDLGEQAHTLAIFMSDNGLLWLEHGLAGAWHGKRMPYDGAARIPLMMRWPGHTNRTTDDRLAANIDIAPTVLEAAGIDASFDGTSLLGPRRDRLLLEHWRDARSRISDWAAIRTRRFLYSEYYDSSGEVFFREYFDLASDPFQLENRLGDDDPTNDPERVGALSEELSSLRSCVEASCP
jgi:arylsulfatase A-like enzyme